MGIKISQLPQATSGADQDVLSGVQNNATKKFPLLVLWQYIKGKIDAAGGIPAISTATPQMDGTASAGSTGDVSDAGHVHPSDTTKANETELATVETGPNSSKAYAVGEYFCWNGLLYRVKTAITSAGVPFNVGTNCEAVTIGDQIKNVPFTLNTSGITQTDYNIRETQLRYIGSGFLIMWFNITCNTPKSDNVIVGSLPAGVPSPSAIITETYVSGAGTAVESMTVQIRTNRTVNCRYGHAGTGYTGTFVIPL